MTLFKSKTFLILALGLQGSLQGIVGMRMATKCSPQPPDCFSQCNDTLFYDAGDNSCRQCPMCPPGYEPDGVCGEGEGVGCVLCPDGKFSTLYDQLMCDDCRICTNTVNDTECLSYKDRECGPCARGFGYMAVLPDVCFACTPGSIFLHQETCQQSHQVIDQGASSKLPNDTNYQTQQQCHRQPPWCNDCEGIYSEYDDGVCQECLSCPPGSEPEMGNCEENNMKCISCPAGKFSMEYDNFILCDPCSLCTRTVNDTPCNATHDTICGPCALGYGYLDGIGTDICFSCSRIPETQRITQATCQMTARTTISFDVPNNANAIIKSSRKINGIFGVLSIFAVVVAVLAVRFFYKRANGYQAASSTDSNSSSQAGSSNMLSSENNDEFQQETSVETETRIEVISESTTDQKLSSVPVSSLSNMSVDSTILHKGPVISIISHNMPNNNNTAGEIKIGSLCSEGAPLGNNDSDQGSIVMIPEDHSVQSQRLPNSRALASCQHNEQQHKYKQPVHQSANCEHAFGHSPESNNIIQFNPPSHNIPITPNTIPKSILSPCQNNHGDSHNSRAYHNEMSDFPTGPLPVQNTSFTNESHPEVPNFAPVPKITPTSVDISPLTKLPTPRLSIHCNDNTSQSISKSSRASGSEQNQRRAKIEGRSLTQNPNTKPHKTRIPSISTSSSSSTSLHNLHVASNPCLGNPTSLSSSGQNNHGDSHVYHNDMPDFPTGPSPIQNTSFTEESHKEAPNVVSFPKMMVPNEKSSSLTHSLTSTPRLPIHCNDNVATSKSISKSSQAPGSAKTSTHTSTRFPKSDVPPASTAPSQQKKQATSSMTDVVTQLPVLPITLNTNSRLSGTAGSGANGGGTIYNYCQFTIKGEDVQIGNNNHTDLYESVV